MIVMLKHDLEQVLFSKEQIAAKIAELGKTITTDYQEKDLVLIGVLKGASMFMMDLVREINLPLQFDFIQASSYGNTTISSGCVNITHDITCDINGKDVLLVEDIIDTGNTLYCLKEYLLNKQPNSLKIMTFLDKPDRRARKIAADYTGYEIPDVFAVGYGLDYAEKYRNLSEIGVLKKNIWQK